MAHFIAPPGGGGTGYDVDGKLAPGSVWRVQIPVGTERAIALWGGTGLAVRSNNPGVVVDMGESQSGNLRVFTLKGQSLGTSMLEASQGDQVWVFVQVQVVSDLPQNRSKNAVLVQLVPRPNLGSLNHGLTAADNQFMLSTLGAPRSSYSQDDQPLTNVHLNRNIVTANVGPFRVRGLSPAVNSLKHVMTDIFARQPDVYRILGTVGMLVCRYVRGSKHKISNHSWGTAVDLTLNHQLDSRGNGKVQYGLTLIAPIFNSHGWFWGAGFPIEDGMHFEGSRSTIKRWASQLVP